MATVYVVHNHKSGAQEYMSQEQIEQYFPEFRAGELEIVDEIDSEFWRVRDSILYSSIFRLR